MEIYAYFMLLIHKSQGGVGSLLETFGSMGIARCACVLGISGVERGGVGIAIAKFNSPAGLAIPVEIGS